MNSRDHDASIRKAAFDWLAAEADINGDVFERDALAKGFKYEGQEIRLLGPQGIFKPRQLSIPLSITTVVDGPYDDKMGADQLLRYRYRKGSPQHPDNVGLREAMRLRKPLVYFHALRPGRYFAIWPVFVVGDDPDALTFTVEADDYRFERVAENASDEVADVAAGEARRRYVTAVTRRRLHQAAFRERVLNAYREQCSLCRLRHLELLDAAHIIPDLEDKGEPVVSNGLALCNLHHAAYDRFFISVRPDFVIEVRRDVLEEVDGPVLKHALQGLHGREIERPRRKAHWPDSQRLEIRHQRFVDASS